MKNEALIPSDDLADSKREPRQRDLEPIDFVDGAHGTIEGRLIEIRWRDERNGRLVATLELYDGRKIAVVGTLADVEIGDELILIGTIEHHPDYGLQFVVESVVDVEADIATTLNYLASGLIKHIGPATARNIVRAWGDQTINRMLNSPEELLVFPGITPERLPALRRSLRESVHLAPVVGLLDPFGISTRVSRRIWRRYRSSARQIILANPWRLANEIVGVGFRTADKIALGLGKSPEAPERAEAAVLQAMRNAAAENGHVVVSEPSVVAAAAALTGQPNKAVREAISRLLSSGELVAVDNPPGYALPYLAAAESLIAAKIKSIATFVDKHPITINDAEIDEIAMNEGITFDPSQRRAVKGALEERVTIITGPPGTGKTAITRAIIELAERRGMSVALLSPTGRAAKRLSEMTHRKAATIHRWLRYKPQTGYAGPDHLADLVIVDEASMLNSVLMARLLSPLPPNTRLILVGDADQLPAIGPGNVLADLIASSLVNVFRLTVIHRTEKGSGVPLLANAIRSGERPLIYDGVSTRFVARDTPGDISAWITSVIAKHAKRANEIQVLAPMKRGVIGTDALNRAIQAVLNPPAPDKPSIKRNGFELRVGDRVLVTANDYDNELYNGDIFYLHGIEDDGSLSIKYDDETRILPADAGVGFELAYAMTVHKAQGSEFPVVIIPMHPSFFLLLERRLLYTAVARAKQVVVVVGSSKAVNAAVGRYDPLSRQTLLRGYLKDSEVPSSVIDPFILSEDEDLF